MRGKAARGICFHKLLPVLTLLALISIWGGAVAADDIKIVRVGIYENQPKIFTDSDGEPAGFWPDIINYIASQEGWSVEYRHGTWTECLQMLEDNRIDIMPDVAYTEERSDKYALISTRYSIWKGKTLRY